MDMDDFLEPEVGVAVALTAAVASPKVRKVMRRGLVYGVAGLLKIGDVVTDAAQKVAGTVRQAAESARHATATLKAGADVEAVEAVQKKKPRTAAAHE